MNKILAFFLVAVLFLSGCGAPAADSVKPTLEPTTALQPATAEVAETTLTPVPTEVAAVAEDVDIQEVIEYEFRGSFDFFWEQANTDENSPGYGLIRDRYPGSPGIASLASVGFGLTAYPIGIEAGYITYDEGYQRVNKTLDTLLAMERTEGFYYHFVDMNTTERAWGSEVSSIDTAILIMGVLSAGQYFGGEIASKADALYDSVNWPWFLETSRNMFDRAYRPEKGRGFEGHWDFYAEQLMLYVLAAGSDTYPVDKMPYYTFTRHAAKYGEVDPFIHSWFGSIFTYQFSHAWIDFEGYRDTKDTDWYKNSLDACQSQVQFAANMDQKYLTLGPDAWGLSASDGPDGYNGLYGAPPSGFDNKQHFIDDTVPPYGAIGCIIFTPEDAMRAMAYYYTLDELLSPYGFTDAFNLSRDWYASDVIGIDKGITLLMLANYKGDFVHNLMMSNEVILKGLERLNITSSE